jgi:MscS family membrane protein
VLGIIRGAEEEFTRRSDQVDKSTAEAIGKLLRLAIIITAALVILQNLGYSISGVLAMGGVGGIAVGFAAKDLLANFFGGLIIYLDRPFAVGDWIRSPDRKIEGTVEMIGWRMTMIRNFQSQPMYVPNSVFTNIIVENPSRMANRRIYETIGLRYSDLTSMDKVVAEVQAMLKNHDEIDAERTLIVNFNEFSDSSVDFFVYCFTKTTQWVKFHEVKQNVMLRIAEIITANNAEIAFPTSTIHIGEAITIDNS